MTVSLTHTVDAVSQVPELLGVVQHFDALGVGIVAHCEGPGDGGCKFPAGQRDVDVRQSFLSCRLKTQCLKRVVFPDLTFSLASSKLSATK